MGNIFNDIKTAAGVYCDIRKARKQGKAIRLSHSVPLVHMGYWGFTIEFTILTGQLRPVVMEVFKTFLEEVQHRFTFSPAKPGEWVERTRYWKEHLQPVLSPKQYHEAMIIICSWYAHCVRNRLEAVV